ncbi:tigger transposable element-derived protein 1-like [Mauremys reevesii]|uniref:tigger transposable element-derived protein 1-like n=1 Tax=Mauremys reevesii TaxID=260615 RepID=UPI00193FF172|nr:tigger transposable element-derived protein 1-like [Mauremys reevesii]
MSAKRIQSVKSGPVFKRQHKDVKLEVKLDVIKRSERGELAADIARILGLPASTVRSIFKSVDQIRESTRSTTKWPSMKITKQKSSTMEKIECLLADWIDDFYEKKTPVIQAKATSLYNDLKEREGESSTAEKETFNANHGCFHRFQKSTNLHDVKLIEEVASADEEAAKMFLAQLNTIVSEGGYSPKQVFNVNEMGLYWKKMPTRTYISCDEKTAPGFKASKGRLTLLLGGNAEGNYKLKLLFAYHSENPRAVRGYINSRLPVIWKLNRKAWMTCNIFHEWFVDHAVPEFKAYHQKENLAFKILLLLDNASVYKLDYKALCPSIKFLFLLPNTTSLLQPMDQGVMATLKAYYLRRTFSMLIKETAGCPQLRGISALKQEIVKLANNVGFEEVEDDDVQVLLESHTEQLTNEELIELDQ